MSLEILLQSTLVDEVRVMYHAERQLLAVLPKLVKAAKSSVVRASLQRRLGETEEHVIRLELVLASLGRPGRVNRGRSGGMHGILDDAMERVGDGSRSVAVDARLIADVLRVQHYQISTYRTLRSWADMLSHERARRLLFLTLEEEIVAEATLREVADAGVRELVRNDQRSRLADPAVRVSRPLPDQGALSTHAQRRPACDPAAGR